MSEKYLPYETHTTHLKNGGKRKELKYNSTRPLTRAIARVISINILSVNMYQNSLVEWK